MEIIKSKKEYDVIVVGSGAGGGMATKILSDAGISVALVESGPYFDPANPEQQTQNGLGNHLEGVLELIERSVTFTCLTETGLLMVNHIHQ